MYTND